MKLEIIPFKLELYGQRFHFEDNPYDYFHKQCADYNHASMQKLYCILNYRDHKFYFGSKDVSLLDHSEAVEPVVIPEGTYAFCSKDELDEMHEHLLKTKYRPDHNNFMYIEVFDPQANDFYVYTPLRDNGLNLNELVKLPPGQSKAIKSTYINTFARPTSPCVQRYHQPKPGPHGHLDLPYLWDCIPFIDKDIITFEELNSYRNRLGEVLFFWDAHPDIPYLYPLGRENIFRMDFTRLLDHYFLRNFCEDVYIFDHSLSWTFLLTHEPQNARDDKVVRLGKVQGANV